MKFYEFNNFAYYALIAANNKEDAKEEYVNVVAEIEQEEENAEPLELVLEEVKNRYIDCLMENEDKTEDEAEKEFNKIKECILSNLPYVVLIDGSLV